jgi:hypothetical protein
MQQREAVVAGHALEDSEPLAEELSWKSESHLPATHPAPGLEVTRCAGSAPHTLEILEQVLSDVLLKGSHKASLNGGHVVVLLAGTALPPVAALRNTLLGQPVVPAQVKVPAVIAVAAGNIRGQTARSRHQLA